MKSLLLAASLLAASVTCAAVESPAAYHDAAPAPATAAEREIAALFDRWNTALATGNFLAWKPHGTINYRQIRLLADNSAFDSGAYTFDIVKNGKPAKVRARYTYIYKKIDGDWKIVNHHSSAMPEFTKDE